MTIERPTPAIRPPVALGCTLVVALAIFAVFVAVLGFAYLESGADSGKVTLNDRDSYGLGTVEYVGAHNFFLVRLADGSYLALADLDAANRANPQRRCRVAPVALNDPALPGLLDRYRSGMSPGAVGSTLLFREDCNGAVYDVTGARLDADGPNLDRFAVSTGRDRQVVVDLRNRTCTEHAGALAAVPARCR